MPTYLSPGVYVEEVEAGSRPIEGVGTAVAAFVGMTAAGPFNEPTMVTNWSQFVKVFATETLEDGTERSVFLADSYLRQAVYGYFLNGGGTCYVVRIGGTGSEANARGEIPLGRDRALPYRVLALKAGPAGNDITVEVQDSADSGG